MKSILYFFSCILLFYACCPCVGDICESEKPTFSLKILENSTNEDLIFGDSSKYDASKFVVYSLEQSDTIFHDFFTSFNGTDSLLIFHLNPKCNQVFLKLSSSETDTIMVSYLTIMDNECCPNDCKLNTFSYNNVNFSNEFQNFVIHK